MTIDTTMYVPAPSRISAYLDWLQMLTGAGLILFMWSHMIMVSSVILGPGVMNALAEFLEEYYMAQVGGPIVAFIFLLHFVLAARKVPFRTEQQSTIWKFSRQLRHTDTWLWMIQAFTAMIILIMGSVHMWTVLSDFPITAAKSAARVQGGGLACFLPDSFTHSGASRGDRLLSDCSKVGLCPPKGAERF